MLDSAKEILFDLFFLKELEEFISFNLDSNKFQTSTPLLERVCLT